MNSKLLLVVAFFAATTHLCLAQGDNAHFHSIGTKAVAPTIAEATPVDSLATERGSASLSLEEIENLISEYERRIFVRDSIANASRKLGDADVLRYYDGDSHELNLDNLVSVVREVGLEAQLFVLAQALLETGHFRSRVCKVYHNLFGLYDSKRKGYFRFARWEDSVVAYQRMIQRRYNGGNYLDFLRRIGYAEDPRYTAKVAKIAVNLYKKMFGD